MLNIAIISGPENGSPKVLAETLDALVKTTEHSSKVFYQAKALRRLLPAKKVKYNSVVWFLYKLLFRRRDNNLFKQLKEMDAIVICDWTPHGFYNDTYDIEKLKSIVTIPVLYYAVQFLENSPTIIDRLKSGNHQLTEKYDWHLSVSSITELRGTPSPPWSQIGMYLKSTGLKPNVKKEFFAIVDFLRPGYESYRNDQIAVLEELNIPYISLEKHYSLNDIREIYKRASICFLQFPEAFGLPIAECLACGSYIGTPESSWAMSWRLDEKVELHGPGKLADCFVVYKDASGLKQKLQEIVANYHLEETPLEVFKTFTEYYGSYYEGNLESLNEVFKMIKEKTIVH